MNIKRAIFLLITLVAGAILWPVPSWAYTGTGTEDEPYLVDNWNDLNTLVSNSCHIKLTNNINSMTYLVIPPNKTITIDLNGYKIDRGLAQNNETVSGVGCVIKISGNYKNDQYGTLIINDSYTGNDRTHTIRGGVTIVGGLITGGNNTNSIEANGYGGGICNMGHLTINKGTIAGNICSENGGGVWCYNERASFTMNGGSIVYNEATKNGGGIYSYSTPVAINGGSISHNSAAGEGGGAWAKKTTLTSGVIEYNTCGESKQGGGIFFEYGYLNISGNPVVRYNKRGSLETGITNNVYIDNVSFSNKRITVNGSLEESACLGVSPASINKQITDGLSTYGGTTSSFFADAENCLVPNTTGEAQLITYWQNLNNLMKEDGTIQLDRDIIATSSDEYLQVPTGKKVTLDLNGYKIDRNLSTAKTSGMVIYVYGGDLTIKDTYTGSDRVHTISTLLDGNVDIKGGLITGGYNNSSNSGGGIYTSGGSLTLESGTIAGNKAINGGGLYVSKDFFNMTGGAICYNIATASNSNGYGGGVYLTENATFSMSNGSIHKNLSYGYYGGGVYLHKNNNKISVFNISGSPRVVNNKYANYSQGNGINPTDRNVHIPEQGKITVTNTLTEDALLSIYYSSSPTITTGLSGKGTASNFTSDKPTHLIRLDGNGEATCVYAYTITIEESNHGVITTPTNKAARNDIITVTAIPDEGYYLNSLIYRYSETNTSDILSTKTFNMPSSNVTITATFAEKESINPAVGIENWTYGEVANSPEVTGNTGSGFETFQYKVKDSDDETYSETVPTLAGDYTVKALIAATEMYHAATCTNDFTISQRDATVTALAQTITYGDNIVTSPSASAMGTYATLTNGISGHVITALTLAKTQTDYSASAHSNDITPSTATIKDAQNNDVTANYNISYVNGDLTINQRAVTVTAKAQTITYGSNIVTNPEADVMDSYATLTNGVSGHAITALTLAKTQTEYSATAYNNDITPSSATIKDAQSNDVTANYDISYVNGDLTINKKGVIVTALPQTIIYGSNIVTTPVTAEVSTYASLTDALEGHTLTAISLAKTKTNVSETAHVGDITPSGATIKNGETDVTSNYSISYADGDLTIQPYDISTTALTITPIGDQTYTGSAIEPTTSVTVDALNDEALTADYSYSEDHTNVGTVNISLTGTGNFTGTNANATSYKIVPKALEDGMIAAISDELYIGSGVEPELTVTYNEQSLTKGTHYTTSFENNTISGEATVTIAAVDNTNYSGTATATFNIIAANLNTATVTGEDVVTKLYDGTTAITVPESDVEVKFGSNPKLTDEYQIVYRKAYRSDTESLSSITDIGEYTIVIQPKEGNTCVTGELVSTLKVNVQLPVSLKQCEWVTYYDERFDLVTPEGYQAYKVASASSNGVTAETIDYIPKGVPVILKTTATGTSDNSMTINLNEQQTPSAVVGATEFKGVASTSDGEMPTGTAYILVGKKFVLFEGTEGIPKHRCYLEFAAPAGTRSIGIGFEDGGSTSIHDVKNIDNRERWYDLHGQRIEQPKRKGLYIKDGQKVVIK